MRPVEMTPQQLAEVLADMSRTVADADSFEGSIKYEAWDKPGPGYVVQGVYRVGNRAGQGGMRVVGDTSPHAEMDCGWPSLGSCPNLATCDRHGREWACG